MRPLGARPLRLPLCARWGLCAVVNRRCYPEGGAPEDIALGRVALVLALNWLLALQPRGLLAQAPPLTVVLLRLPDGATLRRLANRGPPVAALVRRLGWPAADCYC